MNQTRSVVAVVVVGSTAHGVAETALSPCQSRDERVTGILFSAEMRFIVIDH